MDTCADTVNDRSKDLCCLIIREASGLIERREFSPVELTRAMLDRIDAVDDKVKSYTVVSTYIAIAEARAAEAEILSDDYVQAQRVRTIIRREFADAFRTVDVMAVPTTPEPHFPINPLGNDPTYDEFIMTGIGNLIYFVSPITITGMQARSIPSGFSKLDIPVGVQLLGKPFDEPTMLRVGYTYQ